MLASICQFYSSGRVPRLYSLFASLLSFNVPKSVTSGTILSYRKFIISNDNSSYICLFWVLTIIPYI